MEPIHSEIKVAAVQMDPKLGKLQVNLDKALKLIETAARNGAKLVVLPECALTGYLFETLQEAMPVLETVPGPSTSRMIAKAKEHDIHIVYGLIEKDNKKIYNTAVLVDPEGVVGKYRKIQPPHMGIDKFVEPGNLPLQPFQTKIGSIGIMICMDGAFPEHGRVLALQGAEIFAVPTNTPAGSERTGPVAQSTRAFENHCFEIYSNRCGTELGDRGKFMGYSMIFGINGETLAKAGASEEEIIYSTIDPSSSHKKTVEGPGWSINLWKSRRPEFYRYICNPTNNSDNKFKETASLTGKVAAIQMNPKLGALQQNLYKALDMIEGAAHNGARLIVLPECALTGYAFESLEEANPVLETVPGPSTGQIMNTALKYNAYIVYGMLERDGNRTFNTVVVVGPEGLVGKYRKIHPPHMGIDRFVEPGNMPPQPFQTKIGNIGILTGLDIIFPEQARVLALQGADVLVMPASIPEILAINSKSAQSSRAFENRCPAIISSRCGSEISHQTQFMGNSRILGLRGDIIVESTSNEEEIIYNTIDLSLGRNKRMQGPGWWCDLWQSRRPELYGLICK